MLKKFLPYWLSKSWWLFVCEKPFSFTAFFCRWQGHPDGVVWYNTNGLEPDMTCKNCGDDLG